MWLQMLIPKNFIKEGIGIYGTNYGSSRTSNLRLSTNI